MTDYTLVINVARGIYRDITREQAARIIKDRNLVRIPVKGKEEGQTYIQGYVWDTADQTFKDKWNAGGFSARIKAKKLVPHKLRYSMRDRFHKFVKNACDRMFGENPIEKPLMP